MLERHSALFVGLYLYAGISFALQGSFLVFSTLLLARKKILLAILIGVMGFLYAHWITLSPPKEAEGVATLVIREIKPSNSVFGRGWVVKGTLKTLEQSGKSIARNVPVRLYSRKKPKAMGTVRFSARLKGRVLKSLGEWEVIDGGGLVALRCKLKERCRRLLRKWMGPGRESRFVAGLVTGDFTESSDLGRLGLAHLMAISGFHFSLIAMVLALVIRPLFPYRWAATFLIVLLSSYFLFIGPSPSVQRAWVMAMGLFLGYLLERRIAALNTLGLALIFVMIWDPFSVESIGFQYSFLCTAAILLFYRKVDRELTSLITMDRLNRFGSLTLMLFQKAAILILAVHLVALPLTLFYFYRFPVMSLVHNLVFPFLVGGILLVVPFAFVIPPLFWLVRVLAAFTLNLSERIPLTLDFTLRAQIPVWLLTLYLLGLFAFALRHKRGLDMLTA